LIGRLINCLTLSCNAAKINEETGDDLDDNVMFDDVDGEEDDIDDVSFSSHSYSSTGFNQKN